MATNHSKWLIIGFIVIGLVIIGWLFWTIGLDVYEVDEPITAQPADCQGATRFAVIGDYGDYGRAEADVATLVNSWNIDYIVTVGDNNYPDGAAETIDANIGQYYQVYIHPYQGDYGPGATKNRFFPAPGNHDWNTGTLQPYLDYFTLPGNERYYGIENGPVHIFILDSATQEPDGRWRDSVQAGWLEDQLKAAEAPWKLVFVHHNPYGSSLRRGGNEALQWPFARWGANAVIAGHDHLYERLERNGIPYIVNGLGGRTDIKNLEHRFLAPIHGSAVRYNQDFGAMLVTADESCINFSFYNIDNELIDSLTLTKPEAASG